MVEARYYCFPSFKRAYCKDALNPFTSQLPTAKPAAYSSVSYQIMMFRHVAVKYSNRNEWDSKVWRKRTINNMGPHRRRAVDNRSRSNWASICSCRRRAIHHGSLRYRDSIWKGCVNNCTRWWYKGWVFMNMSFLISFVIFFYFSSFMYRKKSYLITF